MICIQTRLVWLIWGIILMLVAIPFVLGVYEQIVNPEVIPAEYPRHGVIECAKVVDSGLGICPCDIVCGYVQPLIM
jgi:hypothetical protein